MDGDPKNRSYINRGASISNLFNKKLLAGLVKLNRILKIQTGDEPIHLPQIRSQQHLILPTSIYHYSENAISNVSSVAWLVNEYYTIYNIRDDNAIYMWSKEYRKHI